MHEIVAEVGEKKCYRDWRVWFKKVVSEDGVSDEVICKTVEDPVEWLTGVCSTRAIFV